VIEAKLLVAAPDFLDSRVSCWYAAHHIWRRRIMLEGLFQPMHLLVIFGIALLVFGPKKLPELGKGIGDGIRGFKSAMREKTEEESTESESSVSSKTKTQP
jgi:sec-independent protein translocase protein TatA